MFLDCDNFKQINDEYGHHIGDEFLKAYTKRLKSCVRKGDRIYRLGGDEFIIILNVTNGRKLNKLLGGFTYLFSKAGMYGAIVCAQQLPSVSLFIQKTGNRLLHY
ncbi:GGDEF domain-containing protein [Priestia megaterium]